MVVFGCTLNNLAVMHYKAVPTFLEKCFAFLLQHGICKEGIFRISGEHTELARFQSMIDATDDITLPDNTSPYVVANMVTRFFRSIPNHVLIDANADEWQEAKTVEDVKQLFSLLPLINRAVLSRLIGFITIVHKNKDKNKMTSQALAIVISPNLIEKNDDVMFLLPKEIVMMMIEHYEEIFAPMSALDDKGNFLSMEEFSQSIGSICMEFFCKSSPVPLKLKPAEEEKHCRLNRNLQIDRPEFDDIYYQLINNSTDQKAKKVDNILKKPTIV